MLETVGRDQKNWQIYRPPTLTILGQEVLNHALQLDPVRAKRGSYKLK
ncbi:hypothetical protein [Desulfosporosinus lacus]|nr:hypothetical protein [Desulfosporosinus lacus]